MSYHADQITLFARSSNTNLVLHTYSYLCAIVIPCSDTVIVVDFCNMSVVCYTPYFKTDLSMSTYTYYCLEIFSVYIVIQMHGLCYGLAGVAETSGN